MLAQTAQYFPNFPVRRYIRRFRSEMDGETSAQGPIELPDPEVVCFKLKMDRSALTPGVMLVSCPHCLVLLGFALLADPEGVSAVGDLLGTRDWRPARSV